MSKKPYVPTQWDNHAGEYIDGWRDAEQALPLGAHGPDTPSKYAKWAYEAGYADYAAKLAREATGGAS